MGSTIVISRYLFLGSNARFMSYINTKDIGVFDVSASEADEIIRQGNATVASGLLWGICIRGTFSYQLSQSRHDIGCGGVFFALPGQFFSVLECSPDWEATVVFVTFEYLLKMGSRNDLLLVQDGDSAPESLASALGSFSAATAPDIVLSSDVVCDLQHILAVLRRRTYPQQAESNLLLTVPLLQMLLLLTVDSKPSGSVKVRPLSRQEQLSKDFFVLLLRHHKQQHEVSYYATQLFVTPKYLSSVVRKTTGWRIQDCLSRLLLFSAKHLLRNSRLSIQQISNELHFSSPSSFVRFFHRLTGSTPRQYRTKV